MDSVGVAFLMAQVGHLCCLDKPLAFLCALVKEISRVGFVAGFPK